MKSSAKRGASSKFVVEWQQEDLLLVTPRIKRHASAKHLRGRVSGANDFDAIVMHDLPTRPDSPAPDVRATRGWLQLHALPNGFADCIPIPTAPHRAALG